MRSQAVYLVGSYLATYVAKLYVLLFLSSFLPLVSLCLLPKYRLGFSKAWLIELRAYFFVGLAYRGLIFPITLRNFQELS